MNILLTVPECLKSSLVKTMQKRIRFVILWCVLFPLLLLSSCVDRLYGFETDYSTGVPLTPEMIESIIDAATVIQPEIYPTETDSSGSLIVYWLPGGSVWHASKSCSSVERSKNARNGSIVTAISEGKNRPCQICSGNIEYTVESEVTICQGDFSEDISSAESETQKYPKEYSQDGKLLVYWTKSGSVWHESSSCSSLANTPIENLVCGSEDEALSAGKERACKKCS